MISLSPILVALLEAPLPTLKRSQHALENYGLIISRAFLRRHVPSKELTQPNPLG